MTLSLEQFNKLVTRDEHENLEKKVDRIGENVDKILGVVEGIATKHSDFEQELVANQGAHDRYEKRISALESTG